jgi:hypothetical protein
VGSSDVNVYANADCNSNRNDRSEPNAFSRRLADAVDSASWRSDHESVGLDAATLLQIAEKSGALQVNIFLAIRSGTTARKS